MIHTARRSRDGGIIWNPWSGLPYLLSWSAVWYNTRIMHYVLNHPLVSHRVTMMRDRATPPKLFRELVNEITEFLAFEALKDVKMKEVDVVTPVAETRGALVDERIVLVPILRAGMGMLDAMLHVLPYAKVGVLGMQRNEATAEPIPDYAKVPPA